MIKLKGIQFYPLTITLQLHLDSIGSTAQKSVLGYLRIIFQIKITLVSTVSASSRSLHLVSSANDLWLSMYAAVAKIFCVCAKTENKAYSPFPWEVKS